MSQDQGAQALSALRGIWDAKAQTSVDIDEAGGNTKICKNTANLGFKISEDDEGDSLRTAWKAKLEREGKLAPDATSVRDLVLGEQSK